MIIIIIIIIVTILIVLLWLVVVVVVVIVVVVESISSFSLLISITSFLLSINRSSVLLKEHQSRPGFARSLKFTHRLTSSLAESTITTVVYVCCKFFLTRSAAHMQATRIWRRYAVVLFTIYVQDAAWQFGLSLSCEVHSYRWRLMNMRDTMRIGCRLLVSVLEIFHTGN